MTTGGTAAHKSSAEERLEHLGARIDDLVDHLADAGERLRATIEAHLDVARTRDELVTTVRAEPEAWQNKIDVLQARTRLAIDELKAAAEQASIRLV